MTYPSGYPLATVEGAAIGPINVMLWNKPTCSYAALRESVMARISRTRAHLARQMTPEQERAMEELARQAQELGMGYGPHQSNTGE